MSIVVTGATGQLGRLVVEALLQRGVAAEQIIATGRRTEVLGDLADRGGDRLGQRRRRPAQEPLEVVALDQQLAGRDPTITVGHHGRHFFG